ncbi:MAG: GNAT family N-acetyltransferase [Steroidobacteraceae bacterium]|jgi:GNAT superfamily N-acetyltransferase|nr:GNAT family N-acetyltransferase [Steroidobacteraceae bacterium]
MNVLDKDASGGASAGQPALVVVAFDDGLQIVTFDPALRAEFRRLNVAWLERYFRVEPIDERVLGDPENEILAHGGEVLFALLEGEVVGTAALKRERDHEFELTKMAVEERMQGRGYGARLLQAACAVARSRGARRVILYSQRGLKAAIGMYFKYGFTELPVQDARYSRCDIMMEKRLD